MQRISLSTALMAVALATRDSDVATEARDAITLPEQPRGCALHIVKHCDASRREAIGDTYPRHQNVRRRPHRRRR